MWSRSTRHSCGKSSSTPLVAGSKPGITGLAQVYGWRGATDTEEKMAGRISHDLYYIENWSLLLDLKIIALTVITGFAHKNAY